MAPFNTHLLVAEKLWPELNGSWQHHYGHFCFGCVAPDVDKASDTLTQKDTHFFDRSSDYEYMATHRTATFLQKQAHFLRRPFPDLPLSEQAFVLGYLCHLCVDEVTKQLWQQEIWQQFQNIEVDVLSAFFALDESTHLYFQGYETIVRALYAAAPVDSIVLIPLTDLIRMHICICEFVQAKTAEEGIIALLKFYRKPQAEIQTRAASILAQLPHAREQIHHFELETVLNASISRSRSRLADLITGRIPPPSAPILS